MSAASNTRAQVVNDLRSESIRDIASDQMVEVQKE